jgi:hypothetical protein
MEVETNGTWNQPEDSSKSDKPRAVIARQAPSLIQHKLYICICVENGRGISESQEGVELGVSLADKLA